MYRSDIYGVPPAMVPVCVCKCVRMPMCLSDAATATQLEAVASSQQMEI